MGLFSASFYVRYDVVNSEEATFELMKRIQRNSSGEY